MSSRFDVEFGDVVCARLSRVTVVDLRAETRAFGRARLRELALDAARDIVLTRGWAAVRMGAIATAIGISRQSLHGEFGTKDELGDALVLRETAAFLDGVAADPTLLLPDGLHPTALGVERIVSKMLPSVQTFVMSIP
jgi:AcrR family transcriptional regulator